jgi:hypothetical protein
MSEQRGVFRGTILDETSNASIPAKVKITDSAGKVQPVVMFEDWIHSMWCDGEFEVELPAGVFEVVVSRGHEYGSVRESVTIEAGKVLSREYRLKHWLNMSARGYYCGENHTHVVRGRKGQESNIAYVGLISRAEGLDYFCTGPAASLRDGYHALVDIKKRSLDFYTKFHHRKPDEDPVYEGPPDEPEAEEYCRRVSRPDFIMHRGNEGPKGRYGHVCWVNLKLNEGELPHDHDDWDFEMWYPEKKGPLPPYIREPHYELYHRRRKMGSCAIVSHPTQWWFGAPNNVFCNNIAASLAFDTFCGPDYGAIVALGNSVDKQTQQLVWYKLLNMGYRMPAVAETDWGIDGMSNEALGKSLAYTQSEEFTIEALARNMMKGRNLVTTGPFVFFSIDSFGLGDEIPADGRRRKVKIEAFARGEQAAGLAHLQLIRNGEVIWSIDLRGAGHQRHYLAQFEIAESETAWYVAKCYGRDFDYRNGEVAFTNPIYFVKEGFSRPRPMRSVVRGTVTDASGAPLSGTLSVTNFGEPVLERPFRGGAFEAEVPLSSRITVESAGQQPQEQTIFFDYRPVQERMEYIYIGKFLADYPEHLPMHVPVEVFGFDHLRETLKSVTLEFRLRTTDEHG